MFAGLGGSKKIVRIHVCFGVSTKSVVKRLSRMKVWDQDPGQVASLLNMSKFVSPDSDESF